MSLRAELVGLPEAIAGLRQFSEAIQRKHTRIALSAAGGVMKEEAVKRAPRQTETLAKNFVVKTALSKDQQIAYSIVGVRRGIKVAVARDKGGKLKVIARYRKKKDGSIAKSGEKRLGKHLDSGKKVHYRVPSRYLHLAEFRNKNYFMRDTIAAKAGEATEKAIKKVQEGVAEEAAKALAKSKV